MTIKEAFQLLADATKKGMKNPFFIMRSLYNSFSDIAENVEEGGGGSTDIEYSTEEKKIGKWINNNDLYEKVIPLSFTLTSGINTIPIEYNGTIVDKSGVVTDSNGSVLNLFGHVNANGINYCMGAWFDSTGLRVLGGSDMLGAYTGHIIIRYTR